MTYFFSPSTRGFYILEVHGENMPPDAREIEESHYASLQGVAFDVDATGNPHPRRAEDYPMAAPRVVSMRQARLALLAAGKLAAVDPAIDQMPSPQREEARIEWDYAMTVDRDSAVVRLLATALQLDDGELDALFTDAAAR